MNIVTLAFKNDTGESLLTPSHLTPTNIPSEIIRSDAVSDFGSDITFIEMSFEEYSNHVKANNSLTFNILTQQIEINAGQSQEEVDKQNYINRVTNYASDIRRKYIEEKDQFKHHDYQMKSDILNLLHMGSTIETLPIDFQEKIQVEVSLDPRFNDANQIIEAWKFFRRKEGVFLSWVSAFENKTVFALQNSSSNSERDSILIQASSEAEAKLLELKGE